MLKIKEITGCTDGIDRITLAKIKMLSGLNEMKRKEEGYEFEAYGLLSAECQDVDEESGEILKEFCKYFILSDVDVHVTSSISLIRDVEAALSVLNPNETAVLKLHKIPSQKNDGDFFRAELIEIRNTENVDEVIN